MIVEPDRVEGRAVGDLRTRGKVFRRGVWSPIADVDAEFHGGAPASRLFDPGLLRSTGTTGTFSADAMPGIDVEGDIIGTGTFKVYHRTTVTCGTDERACQWTAKAVFDNNYSSPSVEGKSKLLPIYL